MDDADPFESPKSLIAGVPGEIDALDAAAKAFIKDCKGSVVVEVDGKSGEQVFKAKVIDAPFGLRHKTYRLLADCRNALDQSVFAASRMIATEYPKHANFPFGESLKQLSNTLSGKKGPFRGVPDALHPFLLSLQPFPSDGTNGGNDLLCAVNKLANRNKHEVVIKIRFLRSGFGFSDLTGMGGVRLIVGANPVVNNGDRKTELFRVPAGQDKARNLNVNLSGQVGFDDASGLSGKPFIATLRQMAAIVEGVVVGIETETARILRQRGL